MKISIHSRILSATHTIIVLNLLISLAPIFAPVANAQEELFTAAPDEYRIYGTAKDDQGQPIPQATASLVTLPTEDRATIDFLFETPAVTSVECEMDGSFDIRIPGDDKRWNKVNQDTGHLLIVQAPGYATSVTKFGRTRMLVMLPLSVTTKKSERWKLNVLDSEGAAVSDVEVRAAMVSGNRLPRKLEILGPAIKLDEGGFQFEGVTQASLDSVYVCNEAGANYRLVVQMQDGVATVQIPKTGSVECRVEVPEGVDDSELVGKEVVVFAGDIYQRDETTVGRQSWSVTTLDEEAQARFDHVVFGFTQFGLIEPNSISLCESIKDLAIAPTLSQENSPLQITKKLYPSNELKLRFVDESGDTLSTVRLTGPGSDKNWNVDGTISMRVAVDDKPSGSLFPFDSTGQYLVADPFGVILDRYKMVDGEPAPVEMTRARSIRGRVIDEQGQVVDGAKVSYTIKSERFTVTRAVFSSELGTFEIRGLPANTSVAISAGKGNQSTPPDANISVMSGHIEEVSIPVVKQAVASITGTIMDPGGDPVSGANIKLYIANVFQEEGYSGERLSAAEMIPDFEGVVSNEDGRFEYPATNKFKERIQVVVTADGYRNLRYPFIDGQLKDIAEDTTSAKNAIDLGTFSLFKLPVAKNTTVTVTDESGKPVKGAKVVFVGIDTEKQIITSDEQGTSKVKLDDTCQLIAVKADGYQLKLSVLEQVPESIELSLAANANQQESLAWIEQDWKPFHNQAQILLKKLQVPKPKESTFYRQNMFFKSQVITDYEGFKKVFAETDAYEHKQNILLLNSSGCFLRAPEEAFSVLEASALPPQQTAMMFSSFASLAEDEDLKEELYGEAIVLTGELSGSNRITAVGSLAGCLVVDEQVDIAKEVVAETWNEAKDLRELLEAGEAKTLVAESRMFAPVLGLVDAATAIDLIRLTGLEVEVPGLIAECLAYASISGDQELDKICKLKGVEFDASGFSRSRVLMLVDLSHVKYELLSDWIKEHAAIMPDSPAKVALIMLAARHMPSGPDRAKLIKMAAVTRKSCNPTYHWDDPAKEILEELPKFESLTTAEFDELLFATIEHAPRKIDSTQLNSVFANMVKMVAVRDPKLARQILEPAFENGAWRYGDPTWSAFSTNSLLQACAWIDPEFAGQQAIKMAKQYAGDDPVRELQLLTTVIDELNSIAIRKGMLRSD